MEVTELLLWKSRNVA